IATLQASATNWRTSSRPMPLPPPVTTAVLPANSVMCTSLAFRGRSRYGPSPTSPPVGKRSVGAMSGRQAPANLARELLYRLQNVASRGLPFVEFLLDICGIGEAARSTHAHH